MADRPGVLERLLSGDVTALARSITWAEAGDARFRRVLSGANERVGQAWRVGVTGPPGAGKSKCWQRLANSKASRGLKTKIKDLNPKAVSPKELYGYVNCLPCFFY